jgi:hypothetical protein
MICSRLLFLTELLWVRGQDFLANTKLNNVEEGLCFWKGLFRAITVDVELQADKHVRWDVAERLNHKQMKQLGEKINGI